MTCKSDRVRAIHAEHPDWTVSQIARAAGVRHCHAVSALGSPPANRKPPKPPTIWLSLHVPEADVAELLRVARQQGCTTKELAIAIIAEWAASRKVRAA